MRRFGLTIFFLFVCVLLLTGCGEQEEPVKSESFVAKEALEKTITFAQQQREEYQKKVEAKLNEFNTQLSALNTAAEDQKKEDQADLNRKIEEARKKQEVVNQKLEELKSATAKAWKDIKPALDAAIDALEKAYGELHSRLR